MNLSFFFFDRDAWFKHELLFINPGARDQTSRTSSLFAFI
jgi:hypothetical protein